MKKTTSFKIDEFVKSNFKMACLENDVNMSNVLEAFMSLYVLNFDEEKGLDCDSDFFFNILDKWSRRD